MGSHTGGFETRPYTSSRLADNKKIPRMFVNLFVRHNTSVVSHKYGYEDARAFWSSARHNDEQCRPCQNPNFGARKANPSFPRKRESRGPGGVPTRRFPTPPRLDSRFRRVCQDCPLSLWERVGVREPRGKQAGVNGNEWERQGCWGPSPGLRPPSPRGRGVGFGTGRTGLRPPSPRGRGFGTGRNAKRTRRFVSVFVRHNTSGLSPW